MATAAQMKGNAGGAPDRVVGGVRVDDYTDAPRQMFREARMEATPEQLFARVTDHDRLSEWVPMVSRSRGDHTHSANGEECGVGSVRVCQFGPDRLSEAILHWDPPRTYAHGLKSEAVPVDDYLGVVEVAPHREGGSVLRWWVYFRPRRTLKGLMMPMMLNFVLGRAFKNLKKELAR